MRHELLAPTRAALTEKIAPHWRGPLLQLALAWALLLALFMGDWASMAWHWWDSSTYNHILLVPPIIGWLVWQRLPYLAALHPQAWWPGVVLLGGALTMWLLGDVSGLATASNLGAVAMLPSAVLLLLGPRVAAALLFPLCYALFLVPVGDELVPALQIITADITIALTQASGIPAVIEGVFIDTPVGLFEVAEACSGVKFLVAMVALGTLVAHLCFQSWWRRLAFMCLAVVLPILANGVRAWGTIYIAQSQGLAFAAGFDHIFYGWIFFAFVMAILLGASWRFFDRAADAPLVDLDSIAGAAWLARIEPWQVSGWKAFGALVALTLAIVAWAQVARAVEAPLPQQLRLPEVAGWQLVATDQSYPWLPRTQGADRKLVGTYRDDQGRVVDVVYALYGAQEDGREAGAAGEGALPLETEWRWFGPAEAIGAARADRLQALGQLQRVAQTWYRHGAWTGGSGSGLKLRAMRDRVLMRAEPTALLIISAEERENQNAEQTLRDFHAALGSLPAWMDRVGGVH